MLTRSCHFVPYSSTSSSFPFGRRSSSIRGVSLAVTWCPPSWKHRFLCSTEVDRRDVGRYRRGRSSSTPSLLSFPSFITSTTVHHSLAIQIGVRDTSLSAVPCNQFRLNADRSRDATFQFEIKLILVKFDCIVYTPSEHISRLKRKRVITRFVNRKIRLEMGRSTCTLKILRKISPPTILDARDGLTNFHGVQRWKRRALKMTSFIKMTRVRSLGRRLRYARINKLIR